MHRLVFAGAVAGALMLVAASPAFAHEHRDVGAYDFTVGFLSEPAYANAPNGASIEIKDHSGNPVGDLGADALKLELVFGDRRQTLPLEAAFGEAGTYEAHFIPTRPGKYTFHVTGNVKGQAIDETFTSSPTGFDEVQDSKEAEFPDKDPTPGELASRLDRAVPRLSSEAKKAKDDAGTARTIAIIGIVVGVIGIGVGVAGSRRRA